MSIDYRTRVNKIRVINDLMNLNGCKNVVGLAGPNPIECINRWIAKGAKNIIIYEIDRNTYKLQKKLLKNYKNVKVIYGSVTSSPFMRNTFYDMDFCKNLWSIGDIEKYKSNFMFTFSCRNVFGIRRNSLTKMFFNRRGEAILAQNKTKYPSQIEIITNRGIYYTTVYKDKTPMITIFKS